jgi:hypothetical protein
VAIRQIVLGCSRGGSEHENESCVAFSHWVMRHLEEDRGSLGLGQVRGDGSYRSTTLP